MFFAKLPLCLDGLGTKKPPEVGGLEDEMLKFLLPLIAALKVDCCGEPDGWRLGVAVAQAYKGCKSELDQTQAQSLKGFEESVNQYRQCAHPKQ